MSLILFWPTTVDYLCTISYNQPLKMNQNRETVPAAIKNMLNEA